MGDKFLEATESNFGTGILLATLDHSASNGKRMA